MAHVTANGLPVSKARITLPQVGAWHADLTLEDGVVLNGLVSIRVNEGDLSFQGFVRRAGAPQDTGRAQVVGGGGGLPKPATPKHYRNAPLTLPLQDILAAAGETLSSTSDMSELNGRLLPHWVVVGEMPAGAALAVLLGNQDLSWRILSDGTVWAGKETWPEKVLELELLEDDPVASLVILGTAPQGLAPGISLNGRRVAHVEHYITSERIRTTVRFEEDVKEPLGGSIRVLFPRYLYQGLRPARVVSQNADFTLELRPDENLLPGLSQVPIKHGVPGLQVKVAAGARVLLGFQGNGDPSAPYAALWESGTLTELVVTASSKVTVNAPEILLGDGVAQVARNGDPVAVGLVAGATPVTGTLNVTTTTKVKA